MTKLRAARGRIATCMDGVDGFLTHKKWNTWHGVRCDDPSRPWQSSHPTNVRLATAIIAAEGPHPYHYTKSGRGIIEAVCRMFRQGTLLLHEGDALLPVQNAYKAYRDANARR